MQHSSYQNDRVTLNNVNGPVNSAYKATVFIKFLTFLSNCFVNISVAVDILMNTIPWSEQKSLPEKIRITLETAS